MYVVCSIRAYGKNIFVRMEIYVCAFVRVCARLHIHYLDKCLKAIRYAICYHMYVYMYATQYVHMHTQVHGVNMCIYNICCIKK